MEGVMTKTKGIEMELAAMQRAGVRGGIFLCDLDCAVEILWSDWPEGKALRAAQAEIELNTRGQAFRFDMSDGPRFGTYSLWEFAGRSGDENADLLAEGEQAPPKPTWPRLDSHRAA
jgi:hypothetical protein